MDRRDFCYLTVKGLAGLLLTGCVGLDEIVKNDPVGAIRSAGRIGKAALTATQDITEEQERYLGRSVSARLLTQYNLSNDARCTKYVNMVGATVASVSDRPDLDFHFGVLETDEVNAFAAPGGYVFVTRGMLRRMQNEDELAAVLGHEIGHASAKHGLKSIKGELWKKVAVITAQETAKHQGVNPQLLDLFNQATDKVVGTLVTVGYDQPMEFEADRLGQSYAARAGYTPSSLKSYIALMADREKQKDRSLSARLGTHPSFQDRLTKLPAPPAGNTNPTDVRFRESRFRKMVG